MATNDFLPFATGGGANVISQALYAALTGRTSGFASGTAFSSQVNKVWRQSSSVSAVIGQFVADLSGQDAVDDGNIAVLLDRFKAAQRSQGVNFIAVAGSTNALTTILSPAAPSLASLTGTPLRFIAPWTATVQPTVTISGLATTPTKGALWSVDDLVEIVYNGSVFCISVVGSNLFPPALARNTRNLLINGAMNVNQRNFAGGALGAGVYGFDRWKASGAGCSVSTSSGTITLTGTIEQVIEAPELQSTVVTVSVEDPSGVVAVDVGGVTGNITAGSGRRGVTLSLGSGVTGNVSVKLTAATSRTFKNVQLEVGNVATPFEKRPFGDELRSCMRYWQKSWLYGTPVGTAYGAGSYNQGWVFSHSPVDKATNILGAATGDLPVEMRDVPTTVIYDAAGAANRFTAFSSGSGARTDGRVPYGGYSGNSPKRISVWMYTEFGVWGLVFGYTADAEL